jgi:hypothetical protein
MAVVFSFFTWSCGEDNTTNASPSKNICTADVTGDTTFTFSSKIGLINNSTTQSEYMILQANIIEAGNNITNLIIKFKDTGDYSKPFDLSTDDFVQLSFRNGAISYKSVEGTLTITEHIGKSVKATFSFRAIKQDGSKKEIELKNGSFDFSL